MIASLRTPLVIATLGLLALWRPAYAAPAVTAVAVMDFDASDLKLKERGSQLALLLTTQLSTMDNVATVERQELHKVLEEQELGVSGMLEANSVARIGHLTGARVFVTGRIFVIAGETTAALKVMSTETGRVFGVAETFNGDAALRDAAEKLATKIGIILATKESDLIAPSLTQADRAAAVRKEFNGRAMPSVAITIPEQHFGSVVVDPAAETEIALILQQAGFVLLTGEAAARADFQVRGEAFSEAGIHRGNLVSCRARVEVKVIRRDGGKLVLVDRQVTWAVDNAEHIAAKTALQQAGAELAERIAHAIAGAK